MYRSLLYPDVKRPAREYDQTHTHNADIQNAWKCSSILLSRPGAQFSKYATLAFTYGFRSYSWLLSSQLPSVSLETDLLNWQRIYRQAQKLVACEEGPGLYYVCMCWSCHIHVCRFPVRLYSYNPVWFA